MSHIKYVLYARKSTESEDKQVHSIEDQVDVMLEFAKKNDLKVVAKLRESKSAKAPFQRPEFTKMLAMIESGEANGILCWHNNRLSRNPTESGFIQQLLQDEKVLSIQTHDRAYLSDDNAVVLGVEASISNQFVRDLRKNVKRGIAAKIRSGGISGVAPAGYLNNRIDKTIEVDPDRFPLIRKAFDMYLTGEFSVPQVLKALNEDWGYLTPKKKKTGGQPLHRNGLYHILRNCRYAGWVPNPYGGDEFIKADFPSIITEEEYDQVQRLLGAKGKPRLCASKQFALKGLIVCGECGCSITAEAHRKKLVNGGVNEHTYYHCTRKRPCNQRGSIREQDLFDKVNALLDEYELTPKLYEWGMEALKDMADQEVAERNGVQVMQFKSIEDIQKQLDRLLDLVAKGDVLPEDYKVKSGALKAELKRRHKEQSETAERTKNWYEFVGKRLDTLTLATAKFVKGDLGDKKEILLAIGQNPVLLDGELLISPNKWMLPLKNTVPTLKRELEKVRTDDLQINKKASLDKEKALKEIWYALAGYAFPQDRLEARFSPDEIAEFRRALTGTGFRVGDILTDNPQDFWLWWSNCLDIQAIARQYPSTRGGGVYSQFDRDGWQGYGSGAYVLGPVVRQFVEETPSNDGYNQPAYMNFSTRSSVFVSEAVVLVGLKRMYHSIAEGFAIPGELPANYLAQRFKLTALNTTYQDWYRGQRQHWDRLAATT